GGYARVVVEKEGTPVAEWLNSLGVAAFVLDYRHAPEFHHPTPMQDGQRAIRMVRAHAKEWGLRTDHIGIIGFSAGGHLASTLGTHNSDGDPKALDPLNRLSSRPDFMILCYPVITFTGVYAHQGSKRNLLG